MARAADQPRRGHGGDGRHGRGRAERGAAGLGFGAVLRRIGGSAELADELGEQVSELPQEARRDVIEAMERVRLQEGVPGAALYSRLLAERTAPELDDVVIPALVADGGRRRRGP